MMIGKIRNRGGQSIIEYLLVAVAVIAAVATFSTAMERGVTKVANDSANAMVTGSAEVANISNLVQPE